MDKRKNKVVLSLGGNIGNVKNTLQRAIILLSDTIGLVEIVSQTYTTKAWGVEDQPDFLNIALLLRTNQSPQKVLKNCLEIEQRLGRDRVNYKKWHQRVIDIDVLFYNDLIISSSDLILPHPHLQDRNFVLQPLKEIIPNFKHPVLKQTILELVNNCTDKLEVLKIE